MLSGIADNAQMVLEDKWWANLHKNTWRVLIRINGTAQRKLSQNRQATISYSENSFLLDPRFTRIPLNIPFFR